MALDRDRDRYHLWINCLGSQDQFSIIDPQMNSAQTAVNSENFWISVGSPAVGKVIDMWPGGSGAHTCMMFMGTSLSNPGFWANYFTSWYQGTFTECFKCRGPSRPEEKHYKWAYCQDDLNEFNVIEAGSAAYSSLLTYGWLISVGSPSIGEVVKIALGGGKFDCLVYKGVDIAPLKAYQALPSAGFSSYLDCTSCETIYGCTDLLATNYNPLAIIDDGSCVYTPLAKGCTDPSAINGTYNSLATADCDGNAIGSVAYTNLGPYGDVTCCDYPTVVPGCTNPSACNYNPAATVDDGSCCDYLGCMDSTALNYDPNACCDDGSCIYPPGVKIYGCMDPVAPNYDPLATHSDGSCKYPCIPEIVDPNSDPTDPDTPNPCTILQVANQWSNNISVGTIDCSPELMNDLIMIIALNDMLDEII